MQREDGGLREGKEEMIFEQDYHSETKVQQVVLERVAFQSKGKAKSNKKLNFMTIIKK